MFPDVFIVGAGPTGLMLANQLGRRGIRATIIDRHSGPAQQTRAMAAITDKVGRAYTALESSIRTNAEIWLLGCGVVLLALWLLRR